MKIRFKIVLLVVLALVLVAAPTGPVAAKQVLWVEIMGKATLVDGGQAVELQVRTVCTIAGVEALEAFVYVTQNGNGSDFAPIAVSCDSDPTPLISMVRVNVFDFLFQKGDANASAYVLVYDPITEIDYSAGANRTIRLR
jgi:hypothetical protein